MFELRQKIFNETQERIDNWTNFSETLYGYQQKDAIEFLKRFAVGVYDNVLKNSLWFGLPKTVDILITWDKERRKLKVVSNISEENYIVYAELLSIKNHIEKINLYPKAYNLFYKTRYSHKTQTPTTKKEQKELEKIYEEVLSKNYTWRKAQEVVAEINKLDIYENDSFPHNIDKIKACFSPKVKCHFPDFFNKGTCCFDIIDVEKKALNLANFITEENLSELFKKSSKNHIEEYLRRMILSQFDIQLLINKYNNFEFKKNLDIVKPELLKSTTLSEQARNILFSKSDKKTLVTLSKEVLLSLSNPRKPLNILKACEQYQNILNKNTCYNDHNQGTIPTEDIKKQYQIFQKKYDFLYKNATDLEFVEGCAEILGSFLISKIFKDNNKRTAKCLFNQMLISRGILPPIIDLNENGKELWYNFIKSKDNLFNAAIPKILHRTITEANQFKQKKFTSPLIIRDDANKCSDLN